MDCPQLFAGSFIDKQSYAISEISISTEEMVYNGR